MMFDVMGMNGRALSHTHYTWTARWVVVVHLNTLPSQYYGVKGGRKRVHNIIVCAVAGNVR